jgi:hypothetical protein
MDEGLWLSPIEMGYSIDNISPNNPIGISVTIINNEINLEWIPNIEFDFSYYKIYRRGYGQENWIYDGSSALNFYSLSYNPDIVTEIVITAVDINQNESEYSDLVSTDGLSVENVIPEEFDLFSCYPNPFNPITSISYSIPSTENVEISVYNIDGTLEDQLFSGLQVAGHYKLDWNASIKSSGIYFIQIRFKDEIRTQKVLLIK